MRYSFFFLPGKKPSKPELDYCKLHPCSNGATCEKLVSGRQCHCTSGYIGDSCQKGRYYTRINNNHRLTVFGFVSLYLIQCVVLKLGVSRGSVWFGSVLQRLLNRQTKSNRTSPIYKKAMTYLLLTSRRASYRIKINVKFDSSKSVHVCFGTMNVLKCDFAFICPFASFQQNQVTNNYYQYCKESPIII